MRTLAFLLALTLPAVAQQAPRKTVKRTSELPPFNYPAARSAIDLIRSEEVFRPIAQKLRQDIEILLRDYAIQDRAIL